MLSIKNKSLKQSIYFTCCVLVGICLASTLVGLLGQSRLLTNFLEYEESEQTLNQFTAIDRDIEQLKARTKNYLNTGQTAQRDMAIELHERLLEKTNRLQHEEVAESLAETLDSMQQSLLIFRQQLDRAAEERDLRRRLVNGDLPKKAQEVQDLLDQLIDVVEIVDRPMVDLLVQLQRSLAMTRVHFQQYFIEPNAESFDQAILAVGRSRKLVSRITKLSDDPSVNSLAMKLDEQIVEFRRLGSRAFQATRGYMVYIDVVMAGEISEFVYYSNQLRSFEETSRGLNRERRQAAARNSLVFGLIVSLVAVLFAIALATRLSYAIVSPISKMTETFRRLGEGETVDDIPSLDSEDEIGRMARAAKVFSDRNRETKELLGQSQRLTQELADKADDLEKTNQELDNFAYVASHDLKSPLRGLNHLASWVLEDCEKLLPDESQNHLRQMQERVAKMELLLDDLLEYSRAGRVDPIPEIVDIGELVDSSISILDPPNGFRFQLMTPTFQFNTVKTPLAQVLLNLLTNALKYNDKGDEGYTEISAIKVGEFVEFTVKDNGCGIPAKHHDRVFKMYQRLHTEVADGSGMGLAIVKKQIESLGGQIELDSDEGMGAVFRFTWPILDGSGDDLESSIQSTSS